VTRLAVAATATLALAAGARAEPMRPVPRSVPRALARMTPEGLAPPDLRLEHVIVFLGLRDRAGLEAIVAAQQDPHAARHRRWLDPPEIADRFGARPAEYARVRRWFTDHGLTVVRDSPFRISFVVAGTAAQVEGALGTPIGLFREGDALYHGPVVDPALPESVAASVRGILGLDDLPKFRPLVTIANGDTALAPQDFAQAYGVGPLQAAGLTGAGRSIAVVARSNFADSDIAAFSARYLAPQQITPQRVFAGADPGILPDEGERIEVLLDTEWAGALAPGATLNVVIGTEQGNIPEALETAILTRANGDIVSVSFGLCELAAPAVATELFDAFYAVANSQGQTVLVASGDSGAMDCLPSNRSLAVSGLASSPHAIAVGGTSFALDPMGSVPAVPVESVWDDDFGASGGGRSIVFAMPTYQTAAGLASLSASRVLPDVAVAGSPRDPGYVIVEEGTDRVVGGTSAGVPALAGVLALINQQLAQGAGVTGGLGQLLPQLYRLGNEQTRGLRGPVFRDVALGSNGAFAAGPGFDVASGWGAPLADALAGALQGPGRCEPELLCLVPSDRSTTGCAGEWMIEQDLFEVRGNGLPTPRQTCRDGDPQCDADGVADGRCTIAVGLCLNVFDFRPPLLVRSGRRKGLPRCQPGRVRRVRVLSPPQAVRDPVQVANRAAISAAIRGLPSVPTSLSNSCTALVPVTVPVNGRVTLRARVADTRGPVEPRVTLRCTGS
jgi:kumamolisin